MKELTKEQKIAMIDYAIEILQPNFSYICNAFRLYYSDILNLEYAELERNNKFEHTFPEFLKYSLEKKMWSADMEMFKTEILQDKIQFLTELKQIINDNN
jgi:hypothetical protein